MADPVPGAKVRKKCTKSERAAALTAAEASGTSGEFPSAIDPCVLWLKNDFSSGRSNIYDHCGQEGKPVLVNTVTLDEFLKELDIVVDFIKMDIEGAEVLALKGMDRTLTENQNIKLIIEFFAREKRRH